MAACRPTDARPSTDNVPSPLDIDMSYNVPLNVTAATPILHRPREEAVRIDELSHRHARISLNVAARPIGSASTDQHSAMRRRGEQAAAMTLFAIMPSRLFKTSLAYIAVIDLLGSARRSRSIPQRILVRGSISSPKYRGAASPACHRPHQNRGRRGERRRAPASYRWRAAARRAVESQAPASSVA